MAKYLSFGTTGILGSLFALLAIVSLFFTLIVPRTVAGEEFPPVIHYNGVIPVDHITGGGSLPLSLVFSLYDQPSSGKLLWTEAQNIVVATDGTFRALLGSVVPFSTVQDEVGALFSDHQRWLGVRVNGEEEIVPRQRIVSGSSIFESSESCPEDMVDMGEFCIDRIPVRSQVNWYVSSEACEVLGKRLCTNDEWLEACDVAPNNEVEMLPPPKHESEWLHNWVFETSSKVFASVNRGYYRCSTVSHPWPSDRPYAIKWYRCCK
tara:strand:- start:2375 stop:3166 length:792 start_codon:yes stop_codon:yes gene_type:complete